MKRKKESEEESFPHFLMELLGWALGRIRDFYFFQEGKDTQEPRNMRDKRDKRNRNENRPFFKEKTIKDLYYTG